MRAFVTGGAGFIGSHLTDRLVEEGQIVTVYDNFSSGRIEFVGDHVGRQSFKVVEGDLLDLDKLRGAISGCDTVFHLAANPDARLGIEKTDLDLKLETIATYNVLEAMRLNGARRMVFTCSGTVYGETPRKPLPEHYGPALPTSLYGAGKLACEGLISAFCHTFGMQAWIFRLANIVGARATHGVIFDFVNKLRANPKVLEILGNGSQRKPYLHVQDCVDAILHGLRHSHERVNVFNVSCRTTTDVNAIARFTAKAMGLEGAEFRPTGGDRGWPGDVPRVRLSAAKLAKLGWEASLTSDQAVRKAIVEFLDGGSLERTGRSGR